MENIKSQIVINQKIKKATMQNIIKLFILLCSQASYGLVCIYSEDTPQVLVLCRSVGMCQSVGFTGSDNEKRPVYPFMRSFSTTNYIIE